MNLGLLNTMSHLDCCRTVQHGVGFYSNRKIGPQGRLNGQEALHRKALLLFRKGKVFRKAFSVGVARVREGIELAGGKALGSHSQGLAGILFRPAIPRQKPVVRTEWDLLPVSAAKELVDGHAGALARDIP